MKILYRYILREHIAPFFFAFFVITFLLIIDYVPRIIDTVIDKNIGLGVVLELIGLNLAWMLALSIPMSVLVATLMAFGRLSGDFEIIAEAGDGREALKLIRELGPDVAVVDVQMHHIYGIEVLREVQYNSWPVAVVILTSYDDDPNIGSLLKAGGNGFALQTASPDDIVDAVWDAYHGKTTLDPSVLPHVMAQVSRMDICPEITPLTEAEVERLMKDQAQERGDSDTLQRLIFMDCSALRTPSDFVQEIVRRLREANVPVGPINGLDEVFSDPVVRHLGLIAEVDHPTAGRVRAPGIPVFLWLRSIVGQKLIDLARHHLGAKMRDAPARSAIWPPAQ